MIVITDTEAVLAGGVRQTRVVVKWGDETARTRWTDDMKCASREQGNAENSRQVSPQTKDLLIKAHRRLEAVAAAALNRLPAGRHT